MRWQTQCRQTWSPRADHAQEARRERLIAGGAVTFPASECDSGTRPPHLKRLFEAVLPVTEALPRATL